MRLYCKHDNYVWNYKGKRKLGQITSCPGCGRTVRIREYTDEEIGDADRSRV